ncbi:integrase, catalytic region, zinc finger, CCHC-type containing protein [Tanacetum coccineum]
MSEKEKDPEAIKQNISHKPIDYEKLNRLSDDFGKRFTPQQELSAEQAFWLRMSNPSSKPSDASPVKIEAPKELPKIRTTPDARTEGEWGFEHTKAVFNNEIILFLKSLKDIFKVFDKDLLNEIMGVQTFFDQMDAAVQQSSIDKQCLEIAKKELLLENDRLLQKIMSQDVLLTVMNSMSLIGESINMERKRNESCDKCFNLEAELLQSQNAHNDLLKKGGVVIDLNANGIYPQGFKRMNEANAMIDPDRDDSPSSDANGEYVAEQPQGLPAVIAELTKWATQNLELTLKSEINVGPRLSKEGRLKRRSRKCNTTRGEPKACAKEENNDLKAQFEDKDCTICKLKDIIKSMREKSKEENVNYDYGEIETKNVELENSVAKLISENECLCNEINHVKQVFKEQFDSIKKTRVRTKEHSDSLIDKQNLKSAKNEDLKAQIQDKCSTSNCGSKPTGNKKNDRISRTPSRNIKNKVEAQPRKVNKNNSVVEPIHDVDVKHSLLNVNSEPICATCKKSMFDGVHDMCLLDFVENVNGRAKSAKKHKKQNIWKPTGHVFTEVGFKWKPTGRTFTIVGNSCPLTRITSANVVPPKKTTSHSVQTQKPELKVYSRKPKNVKNVGSSKKAKIVESKIANHSKPNHTWGSNATDIPSSSSLVMIGTFRFRNDHIARIMGYGDYQLGNVTISRVYYVEGLGHNFFYVGQFCDADLEVAFRKNTFCIHNLEGVDLTFESRDTNLYTISLDDMLKTSPICLLSKASKTKSWLWHRQLSHLNFGTLNKLAKDGLARGFPRLKFQKDHLCSACALGKSKKSSHQLKAEDTN